MLLKDQNVIHGYEVKLPEDYDPSAISIEIIDEKAFDTLTPSLNTMRLLVYGAYAEGAAQPIVEYQPESEELHSAYAIARYSPEDHDLSKFFRTRKIVDKQDLTPLEQYRSVAGFLRLEHGVNKNGHPLIEAGELMQWDGWPQAVLGYVGAFTPHSLLPRAIRLDAQTRMLQEVFAISQVEGFTGNIYAIMIQRVCEFAKDSGVEMELIEEAKVNENSPIVKQLQVTYPGYWNNNPQLYRLNLEGV